MQDFQCYCCVRTSGGSACNTFVEAFRSSFGGSAVQLFHFLVFLREQFTMQCQKHWVLLTVSMYISPQESATMKRQESRIVRQDFSGEKAAS